MSGILVTLRRHSTYVRQAKRNMEKQPKSDKENPLENSVDPKLSQQPVTESANSQDISSKELDAVKQKAEKRGLKHETVEDREALVVREGSMADNPEFEAYAKAWEDKLGIVAYKDDLTKEVLDEAASKVLAYVDQKAEVYGKADAMLRSQISAQSLEAMGNTITGSGSVGKAVEDVREALTNGTISSKFAHVSAFINHVLKHDVLKIDMDTFNQIMENANIEGDSTSIKKAFFDSTKSQAEQLSSPIKVSGEAQNQGLHRTKRFPNEPIKEQGNRSVTEMRQEGLDISKPEVDANLSAQKEAIDKGIQTDPIDPDRVRMVEGVRMWAMNERNKWVHEMRKMSLPLGAGVSGTTARMTKGLEQIGVGSPVTRRLACIGYIIPYHHHSLVEIMTGAAGNGGPDFKPSNRMYRDIEPYSEKFLEDNVGPFPDQVHPAKE